jgi:hypothetical protein
LFVMGCLPLCCCPCRGDCSKHGSLACHQPLILLMMVYRPIWYEHKQREWSAIHVSSYAKSNSGWLRLTSLSLCGAKYTDSLEWPGPGGAGFRPRLLSVQTHPNWYSSCLPLPLGAHFWNAVAMHISFKISHYN